MAILFIYPYDTRFIRRKPHKHNPYARHSHAQEENKVEENTAANEHTEQESSADQPDNLVFFSDSAPDQKKLQDSLEEEKKELEEMRVRMAAEMDNFKKRLTREHQEQMKFASEKVLADILPALDNLDLAIQYGSNHEACAEMMKGIEMTRKQLLEAVSRNGLSSVGERNEEFNPEIHEAIGMENDPELDKGKVSRVLQRGYKLNDRLLRPAKVMVNN